MEYLQVHEFTKSWSKNTTRVPSLSQLVLFTQRIHKKQETEVNLSSESLSLIK